MLLTWTSLNLGRGHEWRVGLRAAEALAARVQDISFIFCEYNPSHTIHVCYIYLHLVDLYGKCGQIHHTWMLWEYLFRLSSRHYSWFCGTRALTYSCGSYSQGLR